MEPTPGSGYLLVLQVAPGGARRSDTFLYGTIEHIEHCLRWEFQRNPSAGFFACVYGQTMLLTAIDHGKPVATLDLHDVVRARSADRGPWLPVGDVETERSTLHPEVSFRVDWAAIRAAMPALAAPRLRPGQAVSIDGDEHTYGYTDREGEGTSPAGFWDPDPPAADDLEAHLVQTRDPIVLRRLFQQRLRDGRTEDARRVHRRLRRFSSNSGALLPMEAQLLEAEGKPWQALAALLAHRGWRAARFRTVHISDERVEALWGQCQRAPGGENIRDEIRVRIPGFGRQEGLRRALEILARLQPGSTRHVTRLSALLSGQPTEPDLEQLRQEALGASGRAAAMAWAVRAALLRKLGHRQRARKNLEAALAASPDSALLRLELGWVLHEDGDSAGAIAAWCAAGADGEDDDAIERIGIDWGYDDQLWALAGALLRAGLPDTAITIVERTLARRPALVSLHLLVRYAETLVAAGRHAEATAAMAWARTLSGPHTHPSTAELDRRAANMQLGAPGQAGALSVGDAVQHSRFGAGVVRAIRGSGPSAKVGVTFEDGTSRLILARFLRH